MSLVYDLLFGSKKDKLANYIKDKISLMGNYPDLLQNVFKLNKKYCQRYFFYAIILRFIKKGKWKL